MKTFARLGTDKPHKPTTTRAVKAEEQQPEGGQRPLSPSESGAAQTAQQSIDVKPEDHHHQKTIKLADVEVGGSGGGSSSSSSFSSSGNSEREREKERESQKTMTVATGTETKRKGRPRKSEAGVGSGGKGGGAGEAVNARPYEGLFSAVINDASTPVVEIQDLRESVVGGEKSWTEPLRCLLCGADIH